MNERRYFNVISGTERTLSAGLMRAGLSVLTPFYRLGVFARNRLYDMSLRGGGRVGVPVVSVGNLTTGGTGKTPIVAWLANWLANQGIAACIISRGYRALDEVTNDEFLVLRQACPEVPHLQNRDRVTAAREALLQHSPEVIILDDGFQHRRLHRDIDVVLIDATNPWGYGRLLPRGLLREPAAALRRADAIVITRADQVDASMLSTLRDKVAGLTAAPICEVAFRPQHLLALDGSITETRSLAGQPVLGFCGIGNPQAFRRTLADAGLPGVPVEVFPDHHHYTAGDMERLNALAAKQQAAALVTTQKDLVKLKPAWVSGLPVRAVVIGAAFLQGEDELKAQVLNQLRETSSHAAG